LELIYGFIGCGRMGKPMAQRLLNAGRKVVVCDPDAKAVADLAAAGAQAAATAADVARKAHTVYLSLPTPGVVQSVVLGEQGLIAGSELRKLVDFSTIGPRTAAEIGARLAGRGVDYLDAPVSGGTAGARDGKLAIMVAGRRAAFDEAKADLELFGKLFYVGEQPGQAQIMKLANNLLNVAAVALTSEAMVMGAKAGLDATQMLEIINASTGRNSATQDKFPRAVLPGTFDYGFSTGLSYKDVGLCVDEAEAMGVPMVVGAAVRQMLAITNASYGPDSDFTSVCRVVEGWAKAEVRAKRA
jgi:3-hydroxyisobutyrate dehydrogenase